MAKQKSYQTQMKKKDKNKKTLEGGYVSSLTGVSQSERAEMYKETRRGAGVHQNKKRKDLLQRKSRYTDNYDGTLAF